MNLFLYQFFQFLVITNILIASSVLPQAAVPVPSQENGGWFCGGLATRPGKATIRNGNNIEKERWRDCIAQCAQGGLSIKQVLL